MATISNTMAFSSSFWEIDSRLTHHTKQGNKAYGLNYQREGTVKVDGAEDYPLLQPWDVRTSQEAWAGAPRAGTGTNNQPFTDLIIYQFRFACNRKYGFIRRDANDCKCPKGYLEWMAIVMDCIETSIGGQVDALLNQTLLQALSFNILESDFSERAYECLIEVECRTKGTCRGERSAIQQSNNC